MFVRLCKDGKDSIVRNFKLHRQRPCWLQLLERMCNGLYRELVVAGVDCFTNLFLFLERAERPAIGQREEAKTVLDFLTQSRCFMVWNILASPTCTAGI